MMILVMVLTFSLILHHLQWQPPPKRRRSCRSWLKCRATRKPCVPNWTQSHTIPTMRSVAGGDTADTKVDTMAEAVVEDKVAVVREVEDAILGELSHPTLVSITSRIATAYTPVLNVILPTKRTTLVLHLRICKEAALPTANDGVGR